MPLVYLATNLINGKRYIGITTATLQRRGNQHRGEAERGSRLLFHRAIRKYGWEMFRLTVLVRCDTVEQMKRHEVTLIAALRPEYNRTKGGDGGGAHLGHRHTLATRQRLRDFGIRDRQNWLRRSHLGPASMARRVVCLDDGAEYPSASAAARHYGVAKSALIELCLGKNFRRTVSGLRFKYLEAPYATQSKGTN